MRDKVDFLHEYKAKSSLEVHTISFVGDGDIFPRAVFKMTSLQYLTKDVSNEVNFLHVYQKV